MITYALAVIVSSLILFATYKLLLEKEKIHVFNRFYLLAALLFSFIVPFISFPSDSSVAAVSGTQYLHAGVETVTGIAENVPAEERKIQSFPFWLILYFTVTAFLALRFVLNLKKILATIRKLPTIVYKKSSIVLINAEVTPHSFLNYMFINRKQYENSTIEAEILAHENAHIEQKHSLDILLVEILQIVFWINPLVFLYRKAIQLNHEFLADEAVVKKFKDVQGYQYLLINKAGERQAFALTSQFNYLITKKRLIMVTKTKSFKQAICRQIAVIPVLSIVIFLFSGRTCAQETPKVVAISKDSTPSTKVGVSPDVLKEYQNIINQYKDEKGNYLFKKMPESDKKTLETIFLSMSKEQQKRQMVAFMPVPPLQPKIVPAQKDFDSWKDASLYGVWINNKRVSNSELNKYSTEDFAHVFVSKLSKNAINYGKHYYQVDLMTKDAYEEYVQDRKKNHDKYLMIIRYQKVKATS